MKTRTIIMSVVLATVTTVSAQLRVDTCGKVAIGASSTEHTTSLSVGQSSQHGSEYKTGVFSSAPTQSMFNIGVEGVCLSRVLLATGRSIGVRGIAGRGAPGYNYGVLGNLQGIQNGAGVFGCDGVASIVAPDRPYAGLFSGDVAATGITSARLANEHDATSTAGDINGSAIDLLSPLHAYSRRYRTDIIQDTIIPIREGTRPGDFPTPPDSPIVPPPYYEEHYCLVLDNNVSPTLLTEDAQGRLVVNYTEVIPLMAKAALEVVACAFGNNTNSVLSGEMSPDTAARMAGWLPGGDAALTAAETEEGVSDEMGGLIPSGNVDATLMFFDERGAMLSKRCPTAEERTTGQVGQHPNGAFYCALVSDGMEVYTIKVGK